MYYHKLFSISFYNEKCNNRNTMANYTCEFSKIKDGDSTKYVQVPNENTAKRDTLVFADDFNHTPLRNLDKYKITNKSRWLRETILMFIHKNMEEQHGKICNQCRTKTFPYQ